MLNSKLMFLLDPAEIISSFSRFSAPGTEHSADFSQTERKESILIVDDVRSHRSIVEGVVAEAGFESTSAEDGIDALDKLNENISLVLTDLEMPNMNGYEFTKEAKKRYPHIPIVMVTSMSGEEDKAKGLDAGVDNYIVKWDKESVLNEIRKYTHRGRL
jgi:two-component system chemotaxis sensor kinase CheA